MTANAIFHRLRCASALWLALLIASFGALAPTLSHALALSRGGPVPLEICSSAGARWLPMADADLAFLATDSPDGQESAPDLNDCPFCLLFTDRVAPAPHPLLHLFVVLGDSRVPTVEQAFFYATKTSWMPPPRGPPTHS
jgi:hypothetical protein